MNSILLTGYSGFIGSQLLNKLEDDFKVTLLGRSTPFYEKCTFYKSNLDAKSNFIKALLNINTVIHCAAEVPHLNDTNSELEKCFYNVNIQGTLNLARQAAKSGVKRFIFISSIKVNGESTTDLLPYKSTDTPTPQDTYGFSKEEAENELKKLAVKTGMDVVIIRPPLVYGNGVKGNFATMLKLVSSGVPLPFGCINHNQRSMVYVENLISLIIECIKNPNAANQIFLISDDEDLSTKAFVQGLSKSLGQNSFMLPVPNSIFSLAGKVLGKSAIIDRLCGSLQVDINHTKNTLNWQPPYSVEQGFAATAKAFKSKKITPKP